MIKGHTYDKQLYNSVAHRLLNREFLDNENGILNQGNKCSMTHTTNSITVNDGFIVIQGGITEIEYSETVSVALDNSYCKLVYELDLSKTNDESNFNQGVLKVISSANNYPTLTQETLTENSGKYQFELAQFRASSTGITDFVDRRTYLTSGDSLDWLRNALGLDVDTYDNTSIYAVGDTVIYQSKIYECTSTISIAEEFNPEHWSLIPIVLNEKLNKKVLPNKGEIVTLAETINASYQTIEVEDLNNFSAFILQVSGVVGGGYRPLNSTFCTNAQFKGTASTNYMACSYAGEPSTYNTNCYCVDDTHVAIRVGNSTYAGGAFFGIRK